MLKSRCRSGFSRDLTAKAAPTNGIKSNPERSGILKLDLYLFPLQLISILIYQMHTFDLEK